MKRVLKRERVTEDLFGHASYIAKDNPDAAIRLLEAAEDAFGKLAAMPGVTDVGLPPPRVGGRAILAHQGLSKLPCLLSPAAQ